MRAGPVDASVLESIGLARRGADAPVLVKGVHPRKGPGLRAAQLSVKAPGPKPDRMPRPVSAGERESSVATSVKTRAKPFWHCLATRIQPKLV